MRNILNILKHHSTVDDRLIIDPKELKEVVDFLRQQGQKIVLTGGSWDLLHIGHVKYLRKAKEMGDVLIVAVDSDELVKYRAKGPNRPIVSQEERIYVVGELRVADIITVYDVVGETSPEAMVRLLRPDILVMSPTTDKIGEFAEKWKGIYKDVCEVVVLEAQATTSTSARVAKLAKDGGRELADKLSEVIKDYIGSEEDIDTQPPSNGQHRTTEVKNG